MMNPSPSKYCVGGHGQWSREWSQEWSQDDGSTSASDGWSTSREQWCEPKQTEGLQAAEELQEPEQTPEQHVLAIENGSAEDDDEYQHPAFESLWVGESADERSYEQEDWWKQWGPRTWWHDEQWDDRQSWGSHSWASRGWHDVEDDHAPAAFNSKAQTDELYQMFVQKNGTVDSDFEENDDPDPPEGTLEADLLAAMRGQIRSDTAKGQKITRDFKKSMKNDPEFASASKQKVKELRKRWYEESIATCKAERLREESFEEVGWKKATYEPFDIVLAQEGGPGNPENIDAALAYCRWCVKKGGKWIKFMKKSRRLNYAYMKEGFDEEIRRKWSLREVGERPVEVAPEAGALASETVVPAPAQDATPAGKPKRKAAAAQGAGKEKPAESGGSPQGAGGSPGTGSGGKEGGSGEPDAKKPRIGKTKTPFDINMGLARTAHEKKKLAMADANDVLKSIGNGESSKDDKSSGKDESWSWATNEREKVVELVAGVEAAEHTFSKLVQLHEAKDLKRMLGESMCVVEAEAMATQLKDPVKLLSDFVAELKAMHRERSRLRNTRST